MATHSETFKVDGQNYQQRMIPCGKDCKTCKAQGGHVAFYKYEPATGTAPRGTWAYFGTKPPLPTGAPLPACQQVGCSNHVSRLNQKYCSAKCRVAANRAQRGI